VSLIGTMKAILIEADGIFAVTHRPLVAGASRWREAGSQYRRCGD
jgi:hypothetical protein